MRRRSRRASIALVALLLMAACDTEFIPPDHCGDAVVDPWEQCDDGNTTPDDGCSVACQVEPGWSCTGEPSTCTAQQEGWLDPAWSWRKPLVVDHTAVEDDLDDFPLLVVLPVDTELASHARTDGADLVFTAADGVTPLRHEIQRFRDTTGELIAWVKVPTLAGNADTTVYLYYGNPTATDSQDPAAVWADYAAVLHLQEQGDGTGDEYRDSSGEGHHGTGGGVASAGSSNRTPGRVSGLFGYAQDFNDGGQSDLVRLRPLDDGGWTALTVQAWIRPTDDGDDRIACKAWSTNPSDSVWMLGKREANRARLRTPAEWQMFDGGSDHVNGAWTHVALTWSAGAPGPVRIYRDGVLDLEGTLDGSALYEHSTDVEPTLGNVPGGDRGLDGLLQEVRLAPLARSAAWLLTEVHNQTSPETFVTRGPEETSPPDALGIGLRSYAARYCALASRNDVATLGNNTSSIRSDGRRMSAACRSRTASRSTGVA